MNDLARKLIHDLRFDAHTREHFNISSWGGNGTCGTVGCIAGTALVRAYGLTFLNSSGDYTGGEFPWGYSRSAAGVLGLSKVSGFFDEIYVADQLFIPLMYWASPLKKNGADADFLKRLGHNERPDLSTVEKMVSFAHALPNTAFHPTHCANALENVIEHGREYVDWAEAWVEA